MSSSPAGAPTDLGTKSISKLLVQYSVPAIIAALATSLYNIVDSIFIGHGAGPMAISGLAITFPLMNLVVGFCTLLAAGGSTISSIFLGQKNYNKANDVLLCVTVLCIIHSVVFGGLTLLFLDPILRFFGATPETLPYARDFMWIILAGTPISYIFIGLNNIMRATGYPKKAMISALLSVAVNVVVAPIFIFQFHWGIAGAALGTIVGQLSGLVWVLCHFFSRKSFVHFERRRGFMRRDILKRIYAIGMSPFLMNCCACLVVVFLNKALLEYAPDNLGNIAVGAYGIINRVTMFFVMVVFGITQGMQPILGFNIGAGNFERVRRTLRIGVWLGVAIACVGWGLAEGLPETLAKLFTTDASMVDIARHGFRVYFIAYPLVGAQVVIQNYFQSIGKPKLSIFLSLTRQLIFLLPLLWILPPLLKLDGVWLAMTGADVLSFVVAMVVLAYSLKHMSKKVTATC